MSIIYNNGANGTLKPPILNNIEFINPIGDNVNLTIGSINLLKLTSGNVVEINAHGLGFFSPLGYYTIEVSSLQELTENYTIIVNDTLNISATNFVLNSNFPIFINNATIIKGFTTTEILNFSPPYEGTMVYCTTIQQMVFYQVSPITGTVLGWYNSTGTIKL